MRAANEFVRPIYKPPAWKQHHQLLRGHQPNSQKSLMFSLFLGRRNQLLPVHLTACIQPSHLKGRYLSRSVRRLLLVHLMRTNKRFSMNRPGIWMKPCIFIDRLSVWYVHPTIISLFLTNNLGDLTFNRTLMLIVHTAARKCSVTLPTNKLGGNTHLLALRLRRTRRLLLQL